MTMNETKLLPCPFCGGEVDCNNTGICDKDGNPLWWVECPNCGISTSGSENREEAIALWNRRVREEPAKESGWISVDDRLPDERQHVMVFTDLVGRSITVGWRNRLGWWFCDPIQGHMLRMDVTHWMPLPEPPVTAE